jgi:hypothetical protein
MIAHFLLEVRTCALPGCDVTFRVMPTSRHMYCCRLHETGYAAEQFVPGKHRRRPGTGRPKGSKNKPKGECDAVD